MTRGERIMLKNLPIMLNKCPYYAQIMLIKCHSKSSVKIVLFYNYQYAYV